MNTSSMDSIVEKLRSAATVSSVYGEPVEHGEKTVIPVARIAFGFGGGYGSSEEHEADDEEATEHETEEGGGAGGGVVAMPLGVVEITEADTRFIRFSDRKRAARNLILGIFIGLLLSRSLRRRS
ncbi:GerW family sporulation protein [Haladaptatus sp. GCM10025707]|uniref:GerW family sporulation protein n=1 Tax=unclassified Haladaptatus TaxID=2622732 RepID=UPI0023E8885C|nr:MULTISPECIES: spore germination protein GerW family protein [unclassified Haladaptatus]